LAKKERKIKIRSLLYTTHYRPCLQSPFAPILTTFYFSLPFFKYSIGFYTLSAIFANFAAKT
jgi:hypothetical protein